MRPTHTDTADVLIVGAGAIGLACAWRAAQRGMVVRVIDRHAPGGGASTVAAGMLAPVGEASWGQRALLEMHLASAAAYPEFVAELEGETEIPVGLRRCGALHVALDRDELEELRRRHELHRSLGVETTEVRPRRARELEPGLTPACAGGVLAADEGEVDPQALVAALVSALHRAGAELTPDTGVADAILDGDRIVGVRTERGEQIRAGHVVAATGAWAGAAEWLPEDARPPVRPVKGQVLSLSGPADQPLCERIVATDRVYVVPRADGRVVVGATVEERGFDMTVTAGAVHELLREAYRVLPDVAELELTEARAGLRPATPDNLPVIGAGTLEGLVIASGHFRNGILMTPLTAEAVAELLAGEPPRVELAGAMPERFEEAPAA